MVESMQQSSATPSLHLGFLGLRKIVACSQPYLAVASCTYSFWHGVIPTSYFIFNDFYTCIHALIDSIYKLQNTRLLKSEHQTNEVHTPDHRGLNTRPSRARTPHYRGPNTRPSRLEHQTIEARTPDHQGPNTRPPRSEKTEQQRPRRPCRGR